MRKFRKENIKKTSSNKKAEIRDIKVDRSDTEHNFLEHQVRHNKAFYLPPKEKD